MPTEVLEEYDYVVADFGNYMEQPDGIVKFVSCDYKFLTADYKAVNAGQKLIMTIKLADAINCIEDKNSHTEHMKEVYICTLFYSKKVVKKVARLFKCKINIIPNEPDPYKLHRDIILFLDEIFR